MKGADISEPCANRCGTMVWISQVTQTYTMGERMYWLTSGVCKECQKRGF